MIELLFDEESSPDEIMEELVVDEDELMVRFSKYEFTELIDAEDCLVGLLSSRPSICCSVSVFASLPSIGDFDSFPGLKDFEICLSISSERNWLIRLS